MLLRFVIDQGSSATHLALTTKSSPSNQTVCGPDTAIQLNRQSSNLLTITGSATENCSVRFVEVT
jgi:hypothetical protein